MDLLDILLAKKLTASQIGGGTGDGSGLPEGGAEGSLLAQGANGPIWISLGDLPFSTKEETAQLPANNIMGENGDYGLVATDKPLVDVVAEKGLGLYTCLVQEEDKELRGLCGVTGENSAWALCFDDESHCYYQIVAYGIGSGWRQLSADIQDDEEIIFNGGGASNG